MATGLLKQSSVQYRWNSESVSEELFIPTTFNKLEASDSAPMVNGYTTQGFIVNGNTVYGSVALLPRGILNWKVTSWEDLVVEQFALFYLLHPKIDIVVLGTGSKVQRVNLELLYGLKKKGLNIEVQDTPNACATFNFLLSEGRPAGAALIPPEHIAT
ncbi:NADH dehydrogenase [ubiquinone] 1 alpha subcomplex assembly factor 3-like isoform X2 [Halichondria panicea]|uniref:NADH dehydrogenase [ubiquinone] 1 alpha subcomplex assembly factor 3-like isoform X2 n=1 Tax=Halichondria panicea TaxID=6063 RepID=UPI00312B6572